MPNQMSADSRRVNFIADKVMYEALEEMARANRMSVGELIRRALEQQYGLTPAHSIIQIRVPPKRLLRQPAKKVTPRAEKPKEGKGKLVSSRK